jgi:hypothetical protein
MATVLPRCGVDGALPAAACMLGYALVHGPCADRSVPTTHPCYADYLHCPPESAGQRAHSGLGHRPVRCTGQKHGGAHGCVLQASCCPQYRVEQQRAKVLVESCHKSNPGFTNLIQVTLLLTYVRCWRLTSSLPRLRSGMVSAATGRRVHTSSRCASLCCWKGGEMQAGEWLPAAMHAGQPHDN